MSARRAAKRTGTEAGRDKVAPRHEDEKRAARVTARRTRRPLIMVPVAAVVVLAVAATALFTRAPAATAQACPPNSPNTGTAVGQCAPRFTLQDLHGKAVSLATFRGRPVLIHFWGVPCTSCAAEYPDFSRVVREYAPKGVAVLAVESWGSAPPLVQSWQNTHHLPATILVDTTTAVPALYGVQGTPTTFYLDRQGRVSASVAAIESYSDFQHYLARIM